MHEGQARHDGILRSVKRDDVAWEELFFCCQSIKCTVAVVTLTVAVAVVVAVVAASAYCCVPFCLGCIVAVSVVPPFAAAVFKGVFILSYVSRKLKYEVMYIFFQLMKRRHHRRLIGKAGSTLET